MTKKNEIKTMRDVFIEAIYSHMLKDRDIFFLCADFGAPKLDNLRKDFKDRFINVGIAEQNLINISTGLALEGFTVYAYAIAGFLTMRAYEQIRINLSLLAQLKEINVNLIGVGAGLSYDVSGPTHHCLEDLCIMRTLPNLMVFSPSDWVLTRKIANYTLKVKATKYIRLDSKPLPQIYKNTDKIKLENGFRELKKGRKLCLISTGYMTHKALKVAELLNDENIGVMDVFLLKPFNEGLFLSALKEYRCAITLEEGFINKGGLDSLVLGIINNHNFNIRLKRMGFGDSYVFNPGSRAYLHKMYHLDEEAIMKSAKELLEGEV